MRTTHRLGMLTPSSNTVLEPLTAAMLAGMPAVSAHFARFRVTEIGIDPDALAQFDDTPILAAAELLAHARVDVIAWNGTAAAWMGLESDRLLCERIRQATGVQACTAMLAMDQVLATAGARRIGIVTPYTDDVQQRITANYRAIGIACVAEGHLDIRDNYSFADVDEATLSGMIRAVAAAGPDAILIICTNLRAAPLVHALEQETGIPIYDSVAVTLWQSLLLCNIDPRPIGGWGTLFRSVA